MFMFQETDELGETVYNHRGFDALEEILLGEANMKFDQVSTPDVICS